MPGVTTGQPQALARKLIQVRCLHVLTTVTGQVPIAEVVRNDEQNVGTILCRHGEHRGQKQHQRREESHAKGTYHPAAFCPHALIGGQDATNKASSALVIMRRLRSLPLLLSLLLIGCQNPTAQRFLKAKGTKVSPFLDQRPQMRPSRDRVPFNAAWRNTAPSVQARVMEMTELYIAPVELRYLQPVSKKLARWEMENGWTPRRERETAVELRRVFAQAFLTSPRPRYRIVTKPSDRSVTLEIAITELNPTSVRGNGVKLAAKFLVGPLSGVLGGLHEGQYRH
jgi:hypothetical protein